LQRSTALDGRDTGYVIALDRPRRSIVVSFRGSRSRQNIEFLLAAAYTAPVRTDDLCPGCAVAPNFLATYQFVRATVLSVVRIAMTQNPGFKVVVTGHSLGGILSHFAAIDLRKNDNYVVDLVSILVTPIKNILD
jgi:predicted lipase